MRVTSGTVVRGQIVVEGEPLPDGMVVTVLAREDDETFELDETAESELLAAIGEVERGEIISSEDLLARLRQNR
jgi:hypothetical protein